MKTIIFCWLFIVGCLPAQAQRFFDPDTDIIATTNPRGEWKIVVPPKTLIASAQLVTPQLSDVRDVRIQNIHGKPYLFLRGRHHEKPELGYTVMVQLQETARGIWKMGTVYQGCWGATCSECGFDEYWGCACERYDGAPDETTVSSCNHIITLGKGLQKVTIQE